MKDLTVIIPLVEYKDEHLNFFNRSVNSIISADASAEVSVIFIGPSSAIKEIKNNFEFGEREVLYLENNKNTELQFQVNKAVKDVKTTYFSVLEFDDCYTNKWFDTVEIYTTHQPDTSLFLSLMEVFDEQKPELGGIGYANEPVWASSFSDEIGFVDVDSLKNYYNFIVSGGVFKKSDFLSVGGLKNNIKVFFWYELLLRMTHNDKKVFVVPKIGYEHYLNVRNSLSSTFITMDTEELDFWFTTAQEEYVYKNDRKKNYTQNNDAN
jgi:hypothetical protein